MRISHGSYTRIFLNTNRTNDTNFLLHTDLTDHTDLLHGIFLNTNNPNNTNIFFAHGSHGSHGSFSLRLIVTMGFLDL